MRLITSHETTCSTPAPPARCYSLALPAWAALTVGRTTSDSRATRGTDMARDVLRHVRRHSTGTER
jgi:hypothetical protein